LYFFFLYLFFYLSMGCDVVNLFSFWLEWRRFILKPENTHILIIIAACCCWLYTLLSNIIKLKGILYKLSTNVSLQQKKTTISPLRSVTVNRKWNTEDLRYCKVITCQNGITLGGIAHLSTLNDRGIVCVMTSWNEKKLKQKKWDCPSVGLTWGCVNIISLKIVLAVVVWTDSSTGFLQGSRGEIFSPLFHHSIIHLPIKQAHLTAGVDELSETQ